MWRKEWSFVKKCLQKKRLYFQCCFGWLPQKLWVTIQIQMLHCLHHCYCPEEMSLSHLHPIGCLLCQSGTWLSLAQPNRHHLHVSEGILHPSHHDTLMTFVPAASSHVVKNEYTQTQTNYKAWAKNDELYSK